MTAPAPWRPPGGRVGEIVAAARRVLERDGELTMHAVAAELGIRAPSLYKHVAGKAALEAELVAVALAEIGEALHAALDAGDGDRRDDGDGTGRAAPVRRLLAAYRRHALAHPALYRLATSGPLPRHLLPPGLEDWAGEPFLRVTGDPHRGQALWAFAHGMVVLELDRRFPDPTVLDRTWEEGATAFAR
ncbi:MAG: TetR-like C-terminal domain-containing protein [Thermoanaerobacterales bacterium]|nr:TetR/AcrR family transcriptional regulator [Thermoanaerobacterales bacterium]